MLEHAIPYHCGNLVRVKTFANFAVSGQFAKALTAKIFIEYGGVIINGRVSLFSTTATKWGSWMLPLSRFPGNICPTAASQTAARRHSSLDQQSPLHSSLAYSSCRVNSISFVVSRKF